ncbi:YeeE/YedE family protein [Thioalkalivibrio nitratireducens DSM 14787]|uniref:YeeE/YedE family protein n=1 Tax=Thioalkalivibrio nitratireducens (strain DSM 14787 / UNIQEM 213 / ALEN2) TaxID=1255043 RepID=L0DYH6_THIND|nr:YeeE/YedE family protein [Thioalkalivibrio nitratireducens]AGA34654.1 YeeE/YedE family protein [Thioalkalivibrio nitratireducens DSM 14787]
MVEEALQLRLAVGALVIGVAFGIVAQRSKFCMVAAISNWVLMRDYRQAHAYLVAITVALVGTQVLELGFAIPIGESGFRIGTLDWVAAASGGVIFGVGAMLAGGCAGRTLVRSAEGNLGSLIALIAFAIAAMVTLFGVLQPVRAWIRQSAVPLATDDASVAALLQIPPWWIIAAVVVLVTLLVLLTGRRTRSAWMIVSGAVIGLLVAAGWWLTGYFAHDEFEPTPPLSLTFSGPLARASLYVTAQITTGTYFGLFLIPGVLLGALASALAGREFHWVMPDASRVGAFTFGGMLMGVGAILAGGCNIGHGLSGLSTLSLQAVIAVAGIIAGMRLTLAWLQWRDR